MEHLHLDEGIIVDKAVPHVLKQLDQHVIQTNKRLAAIEEKLDGVAGAFPGSDFDGHRRYHETIVEMLAERRRLRQAIQEKTISGLVWMMIVGIGLAVWNQILNLIHGAR